MRLLPLYALAASLALGACTDMERETGDGYLTHTSHTLTAGERATVSAGMSGYLKTQTNLTGLRASYTLSNDLVVVCGYVSGRTGANWTPPALFAATLSGPSNATFVPYRVPGKGQDPQRIAAVRTFCQAAHINI